MRACLVLVLWSAALLPAAAAPAAAPEEIDVFASTNLRGIWRITLPGSVSVRDAAGEGALATASTGNADGADAPAGVGGMLQSKSLRFGPAREQLCRIGGDDGALDVHCISFGQTGTASSSGHQVTLVWNGDSQTRLVLRGALQAPGSFNASFILEQAEERHSAPDRMTGGKVDLLAAAGNDEGGLGFMLEGTLMALESGDVSLLEPKAPDVAAPKDLAALGAVQAVYHVGQAPLLRDPQARPLLEVYAVEFTSGERLCGIHQGPYGKIDGLLCV